MRDFVRPFAVMGWRFLRAFWLIIGVSLAMLVLAESCFRLQKTAREAANPVRQDPSDPRKAQAWWVDYSREFDDIRPQRWKPYLYFGAYPGYRGRYINIDGVGHRVTPQPSTPAVPSARVFFFGGSTMWGTALRDDHTIPAEVARRLAKVAAPGTRVEVTNYGENGYVSTQGVLGLMLALRTGQRPDVVVFYDGINDAGATLQFGEAGFPQNESKRFTEFQMGRALDRTRYARGLRRDLRAMGIVTVEGFKQLSLVDWAQSLHPAPAPPLLSVDSGAHSTASIYTENMRIVEGLSKVYGFTPIYVWQPSLHATPKKLTPFEERIIRGIKADPFQRRLQEVHLAVLPMLDSSMATVAPGRFLNSADLFKGDSQPVFVDRIGHNTETSIPAIVDAFWPAIQAALAQQQRAKPKS